MEKISVGEGAQDFIKTRLRRLAVPGNRLNLSVNLWRERHAPLNLLVCGYVYIMHYGAGRWCL
jgi:hypothetical protein